MNLTYHRKGDYLYPNLIIESSTNEPIGKYGLLRKTYLKQNRTNWYKSMLLSGKLDQHLTEINRAAQERVDLILAQLLKTNPVPDKEENQFVWAAYMNNLLLKAEDIVLNELVYV